MSTSTGFPFVSFSGEDSHPVISNKGVNVSIGSQFDRTLYLLMSCASICGVTVKSENAESAAIEWRKRFLNGVDAKHDSWEKTANNLADKILADLE